MKPRNYYNPLIYVWIGLVLVAVLPKLGSNLMLSLHMGPETPLYEKLFYTMLIAGGIAYAGGFVQVALQRTAGVWMVFLSLPLGYAAARLILAAASFPAADKGGAMFFFYVIIPLLLNLLTVGVLFLKRGGRSGWDLLRGRDALVEL